MSFVKMCWILYVEGDLKPKGLSEEEEDARTI